MLYAYHKILVDWADGSNLKMLSRAELQSHDMSFGRDLPDCETTIGSVSQDPPPSIVCKCSAVSVFQKSHL